MDGCINAVAFSHVDDLLDPRGEDGAEPEDRAQMEETEIFSLHRRRAGSSLSSSDVQKEF